MQHDLAALKRFEQQIKEWIPIASDLQFSLNSFENTCLSLSAPFEKNRNDKQTVFAGSLASLALLAGWSLVTLTFRDEGALSVAAVKTEMHYIKPVRSDIIVRAKFAADEEMQSVLNVFHLKGRAKISVDVELGESGGEQVLAKFSGSYFLST